jgi:hypothetical protein
MRDAVRMSEQNWDLALLPLVDDLLDDLVFRLTAYERCLGKLRRVLLEVLLEAQLVVLELVSDQSRLALQLLK